MTLEAWRELPYPGRALAIALSIDEDSRCGGCGDPLAETTDPANSMAYVAEEPVRCHKCTARYEQAEAYRDQPRDPRALLFPVIFDPRRVRRKKKKP